MSRELRRVSMDFDWPFGEIWPGYMMSLCHEMENYHAELNSDDKCKKCKHFAKLMNWKTDKHGCPERIHPPKGQGYQMWETCTEGSPQSPVFETLDELCEWLEKTKASWFGSNTATKEQWKKGLAEDMAGYLIVEYKGE